MRRGVTFPTEKKAERDERRAKRRAIAAAYAKACVTELCHLPPGAFGRHRGAKPTPRVGTNYTYRGLWDYQLDGSAGPVRAKEGLRTYREDKRRTEPDVPWDFNVWARRSLSSQVSLR